MRRSLCHDRLRLHISHRLTGLNRHCSLLLINDWKVLMYHVLRSILDKQFFDLNALVVELLWAKRLCFN
jgi:hypothetical protein